MVTSPQKNLELVSAQNQVKSKKDEMIENLKLEMIKDLDLYRYKVRNEIARNIFNARKNSLFPKQF